MKTSFYITDREFPDYLQITVHGKSQCFNDEIILEYGPCDNLTIEIERISVNEFFYKKVKNPFLRFLAFIPIGIMEVLISALAFFIDTDNAFGINADSIFSNFCPFKMKKTFSIVTPDNKNIGIQIIDSVYNKVSKTYSPPDISVDDGSAVCVASDIAYSKKVLKQQFYLYIIPAFCILWIVLTLLNILCISIFAKVLCENPLNDSPFYIGAIVGMVFSFLIIFALFIAVTILFIRLYQTSKRITDTQS